MPSSAPSCADRSTTACSLAELVEQDENLGPDALGLLGPGVSVKRRTTPGGAGPDAVAPQLEAFRSAVDAAKREHSS